jgi:hypothetical protein
VFLKMAAKHIDNNNCRYHYYSSITLPLYLSDIIGLYTFSYFFLPLKAPKFLFPMDCSLLLALVTVIINFIKLFGAIKFILSYLQMQAFPLKCARYILTINLLSVLNLPLLLGLVSAVFLSHLQVWFESLSCFFMLSIWFI